MKTTKDIQIMEWIAKRVADGHYIISEHVVRSIMGGMVSVQKIESGLLHGKLIEIHKNPVRGPSFLVLGYHDSEPIHVVCVPAIDGLLVIIFAYVPSLPVWKDPTHRNPGGMPMKNMTKRCFFCGGDIKDITVGNFDYRLEGQLYLVKNVPAGLCLQCGEKYVSAETAGKLNDKIAKQDYSGTEEVLVLDFN
ncbi:MAG: YgiT-type zinc finger protein [Deltaproteobacteria bacterium]|nr:YgiT-type zinc finger protein [Deltaproteobacteria bacterium]